MDIIINWVLGGILVILSLLSPILIPAFGIWVGLWVAELFLGAIPLVGKPVAALAHWLRVGYVKLLGKLWGIVAKLGGRILRAFGRGVKIVGGRFARAFGRGAKRVAKDGYDRLRGPKPTPPPAPPPAP